ncbi:MAG TPA: hypothetical protein VFT76_00090 [Actinomycetota bacterium]|nr:hypothetical protein [Actinomycetota bacterium]
MRPHPWHDPIDNMHDCETCSWLVRSAFNRLADLELGPKDAESLVDRIYEFLAEEHVVVSAAPYDWAARGDLA